MPTLYRRITAERVMIPYLLRTTAPETLLLGPSPVAYVIWGIRGCGFENAGLAGSRLAEICR